MKNTFMKIHLHDEAEAIGSGRRTVFVVSVGPKWVQIMCPFTQRTARLRKEVWVCVTQNATPSPRPRRLRSIVKKFNTCMKSKVTNAVKEMVRHA